MLKVNIDNNLLKQKQVQRQNEVPAFNVKYMIFILC